MIVEGEVVVLENAAHAVHDILDVRNSAGETPLAGSDRLGEAPFVVFVHRSRQLDARRFGRPSAFSLLH